MTARKTYILQYCALDKPRNFNSQNYESKLLRYTTL